MNGGEGTGARASRRGRRVVITGMGVVSPVGHAPEAISRALREGRHGIETMHGWSRYAGLVTRLGAPVRDLAFEYPRKRVRTMGRVGLLALHAAESALAQSGLSRERLARGDCGLSVGSTHGSSSAMEETVGPLFERRSFEGLLSSSYFKFMSHTVAANLAIDLGIRGRIMTTCSACTSGSQGIGYGFEAIRDGHQELMLCGGAEELHELHAAVFDVMLATSTHYNDAPAKSPRPYDRSRDGLVVGEGAGMLVLEARDHAIARGAPILAEVLGYATNCDGSHATAPSAEGMAEVLRLALDSADLEPSRIDYVNGHGTATELGDIAETHATHQVLGRVAISSTKSFIGHTLGACGAIESIVCVEALRTGILPPTRNLVDVDPRCAALDYVTTSRQASPRIVMNNNFAFGGINTSLIFAAGGVEERPSEAPVMRRTDR